MKLAAPILAALLLSGCGSAPVEEVEQDIPGIGANGRRDLIGTDNNISGVKGGMSYGDFDVLRDHRGSGLSFAGYGCTTDCRDVMAGYRRAAAANIRDPGNCTAVTWGELEGCAAFAQGLPSSLSRLPPLKQHVAR
jgi:hypothetical protein